MPGFSEEIDRRQAEVTREVAHNLRTLHAAGARLFVGTDSGVHGVFPGSSLHREMRRLVELGMSPLEVLHAATSTPAAFLDRAGGFGRVSRGSEPTCSSSEEIRRSISRRSRRSRASGWPEPA